MTLLFDGSFKATDYWIGIHEPFGVWTGFSCVPQPDSLVVIAASILPGNRTGWVGKFKIEASADYDCSGEQHNQITLRPNGIPSMYEEVWYGWSQMISGVWPDAPIYGVGFGESYYYVDEGTLPNAGLKIGSGQTNNRPELTINRTFYQLTGHDYQLDVWEDWMFHVLWRQNETGYLEIYKNGILIWSKYNFATKTTSYGDFGHKIGLYRGDIAHGAEYTQIVYILDAKIGTTREDVDAATCPPPLCDFTITQL